MGSHCQDLLYPAPRSGKDKTTMPLLQCPGPAPDFATHAVVNGQIGHVGLKDYQGEKYVVLVFYPMDFVYAESITPFCKRVDEFKKLNCAVLAMSTDSVYSHKAFVKASKADGGLEGKCNIPCLLIGLARSLRSMVSLMLRRESPGRPSSSLTTVALPGTWSPAPCPLTRSSTTPSRSSPPSSPRPLEVDLAMMSPQATSPSSSPSTLLLPSTSLRTSGRS